jgi:uncharacterized protein YodC (DUF2158 family)
MLKAASTSKCQWNVGDLVVLRSGGPVMTVTDPSNFDGYVSTTWFSGKKNERGQFPPAALKSAPDEATE